MLNYTWIDSFYFGNHSHKLPNVAQKHQHQLA